MNDTEIRFAVVQALLNSGRDMFVTTRDLVEQADKIVQFIQTGEQKQFAIAQSRPPINE